MTPHIKAKKEDISKIVIMPGDPLRARMIAVTFLKNYKLVNDVRNMLFYTGYYEDKRVTIASSGMGAPSIGIYSYELFKFYDVDYIIRVGSAVTYKKEIELYDVLNIKTSFSRTNFAEFCINEKIDRIDSNIELFDIINKTANEKNINITCGNCHSNDVYYSNKENWKYINENDLDVGDMEAFALFITAKLANKKAACILTVSDSLITKEETSSEERQNNFMKMAELALKSIVRV